MCVCAHVSDLKIVNYLNFKDVTIVYQLQPGHHSLIPCFLSHKEVLVY